jgi:hypothetical protein
MYRNALRGDNERQRKPKVCPLTTVQFMAHPKDKGQDRHATSIGAKCAGGKFSSHWKNTKLFAFGLGIR